MAKRKTTRKTRASRITLDEIHMGSEPGVDFFEEFRNIVLWHNVHLNPTQLANPNRR